MSIDSNKGNVEISFKVSKMQGDVSRADQFKMSGAIKPASAVHSNNMLN